MGLKLGFLDLLGFIVFAVLIVILSLTWDDFTWEFPINGWLLGVYLSMIIGRYAFLLVVQEFDNDAVLNMMACSIFVLIFPFLVAWTVTGTFWYSKISNNDWLPSSTRDWEIIFWLIVCYIILLGFFAAIGIGIYVYWQERSRFRRNYGSDSEDMMDQLFVDFDDDQQGLSPELISSLPKISCELEGEVWTIWFEELKPGETVTKMQQCTHMFHDACISDWLIVKGICPVCKSRVLQD